MPDARRAVLAPGYSVSTIINGCWQLAPDHGGGPATAKETQRRFAELVDHGFTTFDCADIYAGTEEALGRFRRSLPASQGIEVHTKLVPDRATLRKLDSDKIAAAIDRSLQRLGVEKIDLLQYHWWDYNEPGLDDLSEQLLRAQNAGKIRLLGVTNFNTTKLQQLLDNGVPVVSMQAQYSLLDRRPETGMAACCAANDISLLPYGVLAGGFLTERYLGSPAPTKINRSLQKYRLIIEEIGGWNAFQTLLKLLADVAAKHDSSIDAVAARWVLDLPQVAAIILGIGRQSRARQNATIGRLVLDEADRRRISAHLRTQRIPPGDPYDMERCPDGPHAKILKMNLQSTRDET